MNITITTFKAALVLQLRSSKLLLGPFHATYYTPSLVQASDLAGDSTIVMFCVLCLVDDQLSACSGNYRLVDFPHQSESSRSLVLPYWNHRTERDWHTFLRYMHSAGYFLLGEQILTSTTFLTVSQCCSIQSAGLPCQRPAYTVGIWGAEEDKAHPLWIHLYFPPYCHSSWLS